MRRLVSLLVCFLAIAPFAARGAELAIEAGAFAEYDDNVFRSNQGSGLVKEDFVFRLMPRVKIYEDHRSDLLYSIAYQMPVELAVRYGNDINHIDHVAQGDFTWNATDRLEFFGKDTFQYVRSNVFQMDIGAMGTSPSISAERDRVSLNNGEAGVSYEFTPRLKGTARAKSDWFDTTREDRSRNYGLTGTGDLLYTLNTRNAVGGGVSYTYQDFAPSTQISASHTNLANLFVQWLFLYDDTTQLEVAVGPTWIRTGRGSRQSDGTSIQSALLATSLGSGPFLLYEWNQSRESETFTYFADVSLAKRWTATLDSTLGYTRSEGGASGLGGSVIRDAVYVAGNWELADRWLIQGRADWTERKSVARQALSPLALLTQNTQTGFTSSINTRRWGVSGKLSHRYTKNLALSLQLSFNKQVSNTKTLGRDTDFKNFLATLGVNYSFDPIHLW